MEKAARFTQVLMDCVGELVDVLIENESAHTGILARLKVKSETYFILVHPYIHTFFFFSFKAEDVYKVNIEQGVTICVHKIIEEK